MIEPLLAVNDISWSEAVSAIAGLTIPALIKFIRRLRESIISLINEIAAVGKLNKEILAKISLTDSTIVNLQVEIAKIKEVLANAGKNQ